MVGSSVHTWIRDNFLSVACLEAAMTLIGRVPSFEHSRARLSNTALALKKAAVKAAASIGLQGQRLMRAFHTISAATPVLAASVKATCHAGAQAVLTQVQTMAHSNDR